jgi:predicted nuclease of restriction endonuclease-like (RecB) superfamily
MPENEYIQFIVEVKQSILQSRYKAASLANREMLLLYYETGKRLSEKVTNSNWGASVIQNIADDLQKELPGLRGFSYRNLRNMKQFFDEYSFFAQIIKFTENKDITISQSITGQIWQLPTAKIETGTIGQLITAQMQNKVTENNENILSFVENVFLKIGFTHHIVLINKCKDINERIFYFQKIIENQWSVTILEHHIESRLYQLKGKMINNFNKTLPEKLYKHATDAFKSEYLLDYINIDEDDDERVLKNEIVKNIKKFIMSLGNDFSFLGNQYRVIVEEEDFFVDLLFFHRTLQSLVAFELKRGKFKPEYAGKMNFYLSALDKFIKKAHENPSIGIILCKEKKDSIVEFAFKDYNKAMGVSIYKTSRTIPDKYKGLLPDSEDLKKLL